MVKEKPNSIRTYDKEGFKRRAACLCFKDETERETLQKYIEHDPLMSQSEVFLNVIESNFSNPHGILLVTSSKDDDKWVVPGGGIEPLEDPKITAQREALEEAGVRGELGRHIGMFENKDKKHRTMVFVFVVSELLDDWEDKRAMGRTRKWFTLEEARLQLSHKPIQVNYLELLNKPADRVT